MRIFLVLILLTMLLFVISFWLKLSNPSTEKKSTFECGFDPNHETRNSFSMRFFLLTIVFLLFDLEITFILSLPMNSLNESQVSLYAPHSTIFILFLWSTYLEWKLGALDWFWFDI